MLKAWLIVLYSPHPSRPSGCPVRHRSRLAAGPSDVSLSFCRPARILPYLVARDKLLLHAIRARELSSARRSPGVGRWGRDGAWGWGRLFLNDRVGWGAHQGQGGQDESGTSGDLPGGG